MDQGRNKKCPKYLCLRNKSRRALYTHRHGGHVTKPYKFIWFGDIDGPKHYESLGSGGFYFASTGIAGKSGACIIASFDADRTAPWLLTATLRGAGQTKSSIFVPAVLKVKIQIKNKLPPGSGPKPANNHRSHWENDSPDPPPDSPGGRGDKNKLKSVFK